MARARQRESRAIGLAAAARRRGRPTAGDWHGASD